MIFNKYFCRKQIYMEYPQKTGISEVLSSAFSFWTQTLLYQVVLSLLYFSVLIMVFFYAGNYYGILPKILDIARENAGNPMAAQKASLAIAEDPNYFYFFLVIIFARAFLYPLEMGLFKIYRKIDLKEPYGIRDLFAGYAGVNFFIYTSYYLFWYIVFMYTTPTIILAAVWVLITLFVGPLMFFMNQRVFGGISITFRALKNYFVPIVACMLVAALFKYAVMFTLIGAVFVWPFTTAMIYALYRVIFNENRL